MPFSLVTGHFSPWYDLYMIAPPGIPLRYFNDGEGGGGGSDRGSFFRKNPYCF